MPKMGGGGIKIAVADGHNLPPLENKGALRDWAAGERSLASHHYQMIACDGNGRWVEADLPSA